MNPITALGRALCRLGCRLAGHEWHPTTPATTTDHVHQACAWCHTTRLMPERPTRDDDYGPTAGQL
jgi:hypothetical protein